MPIEPGIFYGMTMAEYLAIPALSQGPAFACIDDCPAAGWFASHLNPEPPPQDDSNESDVGTIAHSLFLEDHIGKVCVIDPEDYPSKTGGVPLGWTNNAIREARDEARAAGKIPILKARMAEIEDMIRATSGFIASLGATEPDIELMFTQLGGGDPKRGGKSEVTMVWREGDVLCKLRADRIVNDFAIECNLKTTPGSVEPNRWARTQLFGAGYYFGAAWYRWGIKRATGVDCTNIFLAQSTERPYRCSLIGVDPATAAFGESQVATALKTWQKCVASGEWPSYSRRVCYPELPGWMQAQWEMRETEL